MGAEMDEYKYKILDVIALESIEDILKNFHDVTSIPSLVLDQSGKIIAEIGWYDTCNSKAKEGYESCVLCEKTSDEFLKSFQEDNPEEMFKCQMGLMSISKKLYINEDLFATILVGQVFTDLENKKIFEDHKNCTVDYELKNREQESWINGIPTISTEKLKSSLNLLSNQVEHLIHVGSENLLLSKQLKRIEKSENLFTKNDPLEDQLRRNEERFRTIFDSSKDAMIAISSLGLVEQYNSATLELFGRSHDQLIGHSLTDLMPERYRDKHLKIVTDYFKSGKPDTLISETIEAYGLDKKGNEFPIEMSLSKGGTGDNVFVLGVLRDITERKRAQLETEQARAFMQTVINGFPESLMVINRDYTIALANESVHKCAGEDPVLACLKCHQVSHDSSSPCDGDNDPCPLQQVINDKTTVVVEHLHFDKDGSAHNVEITAAPILDDKGEVFQIIESARDVTEGKLAEQKEKFQADIQEATVTTNDLSELIKVVHEGLGNLIDTTNFYVSLYDKKTDTYSFPYLIDHLDNRGFSGQKELKNSYTDYVRKTGKPAIIDKEEAYRLEKEEGVKAAGLIPLVWLGAPLKTENEVIGVVALQSYQNAKIFTEKDLDLITSVAGNIALAVERKRAEEILNENQQRLSLHVENTPLGVIEWDLDFRVTAWNKSAEKIFGYKREEVIGKEAEFLLTKGNRDLAKKVWNSITTRSGGDRSTNENMTKNGEIIICDWYNTPLVTADNETVGVASLVQDVTESIRTFELLHRQNEALEQSLDGIAVTDYDGKIIYLNNAYASMHGYEKEEVLSENISIFHTVDQYQNEVIPFLDKLKTQGKNRGEIKHITKDGKIFPSWMICGLLKDNLGSDSGMIVSMHDITEEKKLEEQYRQSQKMEVVGQLAGGIAHDFNNLLTAIIGNAELALLRMDKDDPVSGDIDEIAKTATRAAELTNQLLAFSRKQIISPKVVNLNKTIHKMDTLLSRTIGEDIDLFTMLEEDLWSVKADTGQIEQVILNLAVNARDAMINGGKLTIETKNVKVSEEYIETDATVEEGDYVQIVVSDSGSGMNADIVEHIFEPFFTTKEEGKGTGLGLATVYGVVKQNNGYIWVYSEQGIGTTFKILLPRVYGKSIESNSTAASMDDIKGNELILLVEDNKAVRESARRSLVRYGYEVECSNSALEALMMLDNSDISYDLIITDVVMPNMNGAEFGKELKTRGIEVPLIYMSGYSENAITRQGILDSGIPYIQKPFKPKDLIRKVRDLLDMKTELSHKK
jgi:PAS domain S-box-containing protein